MQPLREAPGDPIAAFERTAEAAGRARAAVRAALPLDRAAADLGVAGLIAGSALLVRGELVQRRALMGGLAAAFGVEPALIRTSPGLTPDQLRDSRAARLGAGLLRAPLGHHLVLVERLAEAALGVRELLFRIAGDATVDGWRRPDPFALLVTQPAPGIDSVEADRLLARIDLRPVAPGPFGRAADARDLAAARRVCSTLPVGERVLAAALAVVRRARPGDPEAPAVLAEAVTQGPGPRAGPALLQLMRARALADGRLTPGMDDIRALAGPVLGHRLTWREGVDERAALAALVETVEA